MFKLFVLILLCLFLGLEAREICYSDLGCFRDTYPFGNTKERPLSFLPESPEKISTTFRLYNADSARIGEQISPDFLGNTFNSTLQTKFIIHGFLHHDRKDWVLDMKDAMMEVDRLNVITVDWSKGNGFPYTQSTANTQVVGAVLAKLIKNLCDKKGSEPGDFHLIGHSLGAHIAGYAGERVIGIGKITALDPAGPYFEFTDPVVRLDPNDAQFVEAIHTDGTATLQIGLGLMQPIGHVDFYPNGGKNQPECPETSGKILSAIFGFLTVDLEGIEDGLACSHSAAIYFYIDSIKNFCKYNAYPCESADDFNAGKCLACGNSKSCNRMGYYSALNKDQGRVYLNTQAPLSVEFDHLCTQNYQVTLASTDAGKLVQTRGKFTIYFKTSNGLVSSTEVLDDSNSTFKAGVAETRLVSLKEPLDQAIDTVHVSFTKTANWASSWMYDSKWNFKYIDVLSGERQEKLSFCPVETMIESGKTVEFKRC